jgi:tRNA-2-methylthio-N6-dimethylallyladenosine synthase
MEKKKLFIKTYGCQMNVYDSLRMKDLMIPHGYEPTEEIETADMAILNTCHIREKAAEKLYSELGRIKKMKDKNKSSGKDLTIAVAGCVSQAEGSEIFTRAPYVNIVVGPQSYHSLPELVAKINRGSKQEIELEFIEEEKFDKLPSEVGEQGSTAFVSVQEGCDKFCSFCVVPYTRGAEFSRSLEQIYRECLSVVSKGAKEITLLGQNVNAYHGKDDSGNILSLASLISRLENIDGLDRIRYMTSHPIDMTDDLIKLHGISKKLMPFLHLPIQSGSNRILKDMNRKHTREFYLDIIDRLLESRPDLALSSDFIVGFPGETDKDFEDTLDIVKKVKYSQCFSFKYSPRPGTPASVKPQVPEEVKTERLNILQKEIQYQQMAFNKNCIGKILPVLFERSGKFENQIVGKSPYLQSVHIENPSADLLGRIAMVKIRDALLTSLSGSWDIK